MSKPEIRVTVFNRGGDIIPGPEALSLLLGIPADEIHSFAQREEWEALVVPPEWAKAAKRRTNEAAAHQGNDDIESVLNYWAAKDHGRRVVIEYRATTDINAQIWGGL